MTETILQTAGGRRENRRFSESHGPSNDLCKFHSPGQEVTVECSLDEVGEFESETAVRTESDVLPADQFAKLVQWATKNAKLKVFGAFERGEV